MMTLNRSNSFERQDSLRLLKKGVCRKCGQLHQASQSHLYDYQQTVDDDLVCAICVQPLVEPIDTRCGHTFCTRCIKNHLKIQQTCPVDGYLLTPADLQSSRVIIQRLLDKLLVVCPNVDYCEEVLPRSELETHLKHRCCGAVVKCVHAPFGCTFQGPRSALQSHLWECSYNNGQDTMSKRPIVEGEITTIDIQRGCYDLGISIVGGCDTPLMGVMIQEVFPYSVVEKDDRLLPGDQILEVNGEDLSHATHEEAKNALMQIYPICRLTVYREHAEESRPIEKEEILKICINKKPGKLLGIKLVGKKFGPGLYILDVVPGTLAHTDGRLLPNDRILEINGVGMEHGSQEKGAAVIKASVDKIQFVVIRKSRPKTPEVLHSSARDNPAYEMSLLEDATERLSSTCSKCREKMVQVKKSCDETLGMSVSGGLNSQRGDVPLYVTNITTHGCLSRTKQMKKGDILVSINGERLMDCSHTEAVQILKAATSETTITLHLLDGPETSDSFANFVPSWMYWLQLPEMCQTENTITMQKGLHHTLGFSIVGGSDSSRGPQPIFVKTIIGGGPAALAGQLRCGDIIVSVNHHCFRSVSHSSAAQILRSVTGLVSLSIISWPGTIV